MVPSSCVCSRIPCHEVEAAKQKEENAKLKAEILRLTAQARQRDGPTNGSSVPALKVQRETEIRDDIEEGLKRESCRLPRTPEFSVRV